MENLILENGYVIFFVVVQGFKCLESANWFKFLSETYKNGVRRSLAWLRRFPKQTSMSRWLVAQFCFVKQCFPVVVLRNLRTMDSSRFTRTVSWDCHLPGIKAYLFITLVNCCSYVKEYPVSFDFQIPISGKYRDSEALSK